MIIIALSQRMECPECKKMLGFGRHITSDDTPVMLSCPFCPYSFSIVDKDEKRYTKMAKVPLTRKNDDVWRITAESFPVETEEPAMMVQQELDKIHPAGKVQSWMDIVKDLAATALSFSAQSVKARDTIQQVADAMGYDMKREMDKLSAIGDWNPALLYHFITHPFSKIDPNCLDTQVEPYSGFIICPKFYPKLHGFPISARGGYYVQAITPYSQMAFPLEIHIAESLDIRIGEDLEVYGNKIVGPGLRHVWMEIDGVTHDEDHHVNNPSLVIQDRPAARKWMARHGAIPWPKLPNIKEQFFPYYDGMIESDCDLEAIVNFHRNLTCTGRAVLCWQNTDLARMAASVCGHGMRGMKVIFCDSDRGTNWHANFTMEYADKRQFVYTRTDERQKLFDVRQISMMIVDATDVMPPVSFWDWLHHYQGVLVIILREGLLDTFEENEYAQSIYSLVNYVSVVPDDEHWRNAWKSYEHKPPENILRTLSAMRFLDK